MRKRRPQSRCICDHAKNVHYAVVNAYCQEMNIDLGRRCGFCIECEEYKQDNLKTLERLYSFKEEQKGKVNDYN